MNLLSIEEELSKNPYPGRGIILGRSADGSKAVVAYFIMGRSENSRNRIFVEDGEGLRTEAFDETKLTDPSLIIYAPIKILGTKLIVSNGDQTDTIYKGLDNQLTFEQALRTRKFEPDAPNYTPRISGIVRFQEDRCNYALSILKKNPGEGASCNRYIFAYENPVPGEGHFIHTYKNDSEPLPSFEGEPKRIALTEDIDEFTITLWDSLNADNKVSLFVRYIDIETKESETRIINKNL
jgi:Archaeal IMP cyclohydrolase